MILAGWPFVSASSALGSRNHSSGKELGQSHMYGMETHLPSLDQLRNNAAECIRLAEAARTSRQKSLFIEMAERWLTLAEHAAKTQAR
jgi:anaerobic glycerol-3-phosphate dehydrogenase